MIRKAPNVGLVRRTLTNHDGPAFADLTSTPAPQSGQDYTPGFILIGGPTGVSVTSARPSHDPKRGNDMRAYAEHLKAAGFKVQTTYRGETVTAVKVIPW